MCTSGARLQLAIAPAGAGKTTAMRALTRAWTQDGGQVLGLAPSAAAAAVLARADRHPRRHPRQTHLVPRTTASCPTGRPRIGPSTLVIIDEAGMADTLSLDTAVQFVIGRGGSVRLIGDDQQLAAIGAGGVLRDIAHHPRRRCSSPSCTASPTRPKPPPPSPSATATRGARLLPRPPTVSTSATSPPPPTTPSTAWAADRAAGLDAIMLAPTRELVAELNQRARTHRLDGTASQAGRSQLADGNRASVGDVIITRSNDRRLRLVGHRLGQERRPLDRHPHQPTTAT